MGIAPGAVVMAGAVESLVVADAAGARAQIRRGILLEWISRVLVEVHEGGHRARVVQIP